MVTMNLEWQVVTSPYIITEFFLIVERYKICLAGGLRLSVADPGFCRGREGGGSDKLPPILPVIVGKQVLLSLKEVWSRYLFHFRLVLPSLALLASARQRRFGPGLKVCG